MKPEPPDYADLEKDALLKLAMEIMADPASPPEHVERARSRIGQPDLGQLLEATEPYKLFLLRAVLDENDPLHEQMRKLVTR